MRCSYYKSQRSGNQSCQQKVLLSPSSGKPCRIETAHEWKALENHLEDTLCLINRHRARTAGEGIAWCPVVDTGIIRGQRDGQPLSYVFKFSFMYECFRLLHMVLVYFYEFPLTNTHFQLLLHVFAYSGALISITMIFSLVLGVVT